MIYQIKPILGIKVKRKLINYIKKDHWLTEYKITENFEKKFSKFTNSKHCICFPNGTLTMSSILACLGLKKNAEVLVSNYTMVATANVAKLGFRFLKWGGGKLFGKPIQWLSTMIAKQIGGLIPGVVGGVPRGMGSMTAPVADRVSRSGMNQTNKGQMKTPTPKTGGFFSRLHRRLSLKFSNFLLNLNATAKAPAADGPQKIPSTSASLRAMLSASF